MCTDPEQTPGFGRRAAAGLGQGRGRGLCRRMMPGTPESALRRGPAFASQTDALQDRIARLEDQLRVLNAQLLENSNK